MARTTKKLNEIDLNSIKYPIKGKVSPSLISVMPGKVTIGEYSLADQQIASEWVINDQRGGLGVEEMDESIHQDRYWMSTCDGRFKGHLTLPPLVTAIPTMGWVSPTGFVDGASAWSNEANAYDEDPVNTAASTTATVAAGAWSDWLELTVASSNCTGVRTQCRLDGAVTTPTIEISLYYGAAWHAITGVTTDTETVWNYHPHATIEAVTAMRIRIKNTDAGVQKVHVFEADFFMESGTPSSSAYHFANFNSQLYLSQGDTITKLNAAGDGFSPVILCAAEVTCMYDALHVATATSYLIVGQGDAAHYYYMNAAETFAQPDDGQFTLGLSWDEKCMQTDSDGQMQDSVGPATASPTWNTDGKLRLPDNSINRLAIYRDADADPQVYAGTKEGLWIHDFTNDKWIETELSLPQHAKGGAGLVNWRDALYNSSGLHVDKYIAGSTATIASVGLDEDDGLPSECNGEINAFVDGHRSFHALVDSSLVTGTGYSGVYDYNNKGWHCQWLAATSDDTMHNGIESTKVAYRLWFDHNDIINSMDLLRGIQSPLKISTYAYGTSGIHVTPWFDANWIGNKLALSLKMMCDNSCSATEKITAYYRIDHSTMTFPVAAWTGWTKLTSTTYADGVTADGEAEFTFGTNAVGVAFKAIQFGFQFERTDVTPATDKLKTPDLQYVKFKYLKLLDSKWGWDVTLDFSNSYGGNSPSEMITLLRAAVATATLLEFTYRDESGGTHTDYVKIANAQGLENAGPDFRGAYRISLVAP